MQGVCAYINSFTDEYAEEEKKKEFLIKNLNHCNLYSGFYVYVVMKTDVIKANRKGSREAELENKTGWTAKHMIFPSVKTYKRKPKHKHHDN